MFRQLHIIFTIQFYFIIGMIKPIKDT